MVLLVVESINRSGTKFDADGRVFRLEEKLFNSKRRINGEAGLSPVSEIRAVLPKRLDVVLSKQNFQDLRWRRSMCRGVELFWPVAVAPVCIPSPRR